MGINICSLCTEDLTYRLTYTMFLRFQNKMLQDTGRNHLYIKIKRTHNQKQPTKYNMNTIKFPYPKQHFISKRLLDGLSTNMAYPFFIFNYPISSAQKALSCHLALFSSFLPQNRSNNTSPGCGYICI